jgi:uncharacterized protein YbaP (TraB family)
MIRFRIPFPLRGAGRTWRRAWLLLVLLAPLGVAADCRPLAAERPVAYKAGDFSRGLLWKIETPGAAPSYLFGTFHSSDPRIVALPCPVQRAFDTATSFTMEMIMSGPGIVSMAEAMFFSDGRTLQQVLGDALYRETLAAVGLESARAAGLNNMKPWAVMMFLSGPREGAGLPLDFALQLKATLANKPTHGLETLPEQIEVFNGMRLEDQVVLLRDTIQMHRLLPGVVEELTRVYLRRDLAGLVALSEKYQSEDARVHRDLMDRLLVRRNHNMAKRMGERLREGNAFIAVGALHLPGEQGLLRLLTDAGYRVSPVY